MQNLDVVGEAVDECDGAGGAAGGEFRGCGYCGPLARSVGTPTAGPAAVWFPVRGPWARHLAAVAPVPRFRTAAPGAADTGNRTSERKTTVMFRILIGAMIVASSMPVFSQEPIRDAIVRGDHVQNNFDIDIRGRVTYDLTSSRVQIQIDQVRNNHNTRTTGTLFAVLLLTEERTLRVGTLYHEVARILRRRKVS